MRAVGLGAGLELGRRGAGIWLGDAEAHHHAALQQVGQPARLLLRGAVFGEGTDRAEISELHHVGRARTHGRHLLDRDHRVHQRAAHAAVGFRDGDAHEALLAHELRDVERIVRVVRAFEPVLLEMREREAAHAVGEQLLLFGEAELHVLGSVGSGGVTSP